VTPAFAALSAKPYLHHPAGYAPMAAGFARLKISSSRDSVVAKEKGKDRDSFFFHRGGDVGSAGDVGDAEMKMRLLVSGRENAEGEKMREGEVLTGGGGRGFPTEERRTRRDFVGRGGVRR
jgi:hypothetical protein